MLSLEYCHLVGRCGWFILVHVALGKKCSIQFVAVWLPESVVTSMSDIAVPMLSFKPLSLLPLYLGSVTFLFVVISTLLAQNWRARDSSGWFSGLLLPKARTALRSGWVAQGSFHVSLTNFQGWRLCNDSWHHLPVLNWLNSIFLYHLPDVLSGPWCALLPFIPLLGIYASILVYQLMDIF